jgi:hypothetical protein
MPLRATLWRLDGTARRWYPARIDPDNTDRLPGAPGHG